MVAGFLGWLKGDWFNIVQVFYFLGGFLFVAKAWRIQFLTAIAEKHRAVWEKMMENPKLQRIFSKEVDTTAHPMTPVEETALNMILNQYETGWEVAKFLDRRRLGPLANDIGGFFKRPLVHEAWEKNKRSHEAQFVKFVDRAIEAAGRF